MKSYGQCGFSQGLNSAKLLSTGTDDRNEYLPPDVSIKPNNSGSQALGQPLESSDRIRQLFDEMAKTYGLVNMFSSLGFAYFWRKSCVKSVSGSSRHICDLMAGGGECLSHIKHHFGPQVEVDLVDWSSNMCRRASEHISRKGYSDCEVINHDALQLPVLDGKYDVVVSTFGLKTFTDEQIGILAIEIKRILRKGGRFSLLEFSLPSNRLVQTFFKLYVKYWVPFLGWLFLGNPDNYRMLWTYTVAFSDCSRAQKIFQTHGLHSEFKSYFFGSATQISGHH